MRRLTVAVAWLLTAASLWWVQAPPRTPDAYGDDASRAAETIASQVETARLWSRAAREGRAFSTSTAVGLEDADRRARNAASAFLEHDPPAGADSVRATLSRVADPATAMLADLRIAAHNGDWAAFERADEPLEQAARRLREFAVVAQR